VNVLLQRCLVHLAVQQRSPATGEDLALNAMPLDDSGQPVERLEDIPPRGSNSLPRRAISDAAAIDPSNAYPRTVPIDAATSIRRLRALRRRTTFTGSSSRCAEVVVCIVDDDAMRTGSRWFPGQESDQKFESGWVLAGGERWDAETHEGGADLTSLRLHAPRTLALEFRLEGPGSRLIEFADLTELQIEGNVAWQGEAELGWEVLDTSMLVATRPREDGLVVYALELPTALVCFASLPGSWRPGN
jgi:hypothetical protein